MSLSENYIMTASLFFICPVPPGFISMNTATETNRKSKRCVFCFSLFMHQTSIFMYLFYQGALSRFLAQRLCMTLNRWPPRSPLHHFSSPKKSMQMKNEQRFPTLFYPERRRGSHREAVALLFSNSGLTVCRKEEDVMPRWGGVIIGTLSLSLQETTLTVLQAGLSG